MTRAGTRWRVLAATAIAFVATTGLPDRCVGGDAPDFAARMRTDDDVEVAHVLAAVARRRLHGAPGPACTAILERRARRGAALERELGCALRALGDGAEPALRAALSSPDPAMRSAALWASEHVAPTEPQTERAILARLDDPDGDVRGRAVEALAWTRRDPGGPAVTALRQLTRSSDDAVASDALLVLARRGDGPDAAAEALAEGLASSGRLLRPTALQAARFVGTTTRRLRPALLRSAADPDAPGFARLWALESLRVGASPSRDEARACLTLLAERGLASLRAEAVSLACEQAGSAVESDVAESLTRALDDDAFEVRDAARRAASALGSPVTPILVTVLERGSERAKREALLALGAIGPSAVAARATIERTVRDGPPALRGHAWAALVASGIAPESLVPALRTVLSDRDLPARFATMRWLLSRGPELAALADDLRRIALDRDDLVSGEAIGAFAAVGRGRPDLVPTLRTLQTASDPVVRAMAALALVEVEPAPLPEATTASVRDGLASRSAEFVAVQAVRRLGAHAAWARPDLETILDRARGDEGTRLAAAEALAIQGAWDPSVEEALLDATRASRSLDERRRALDALRRAPQLTRRASYAILELEHGAPEPSVRAAARAARDRPGR